MKIFKTLCVVTLTALPSLTAAELPFSKEELAQLEATLDFCTWVNPQAAAKFKDYGKHLTEDTPIKELDEARRSEDT